MDVIADLVTRAQAGDLDAYGQLVERTQTMAYAVARSVLRDPALAEDAAQEAFLRAFKHLRDLDERAAFPAWLRRTVITVSLNVRRAHRRTLLRLDDVPEVPVLDEAESSWTELQRLRLAGALLTLSADERRVCDRRYHGQWSVGRLARDAGIDDATMRKRLQRIREKLRKEIEVTEQHDIRPGEMREDFPARIIELLARPRLCDLPEHPVGRVLDDLRAVYSDCADVALPEIIDFAAARTTVGDDALYIEAHELHRVDDRRILRYDLTLPLLLTIKFDGDPLRLFAAGKAYRSCRTDAMHLEAFHQAEVLCVDDRKNLDPWRMTARVLESVDRLLPGRTMKLVPTNYAMCSQAWELEVDVDGRWFEVLAWGVFTDRIVRHLGGDPAVHTAIGAGYGLERLAMLRYGIDDIRKIEAVRVA
jgi:RNA polymerase sigma-70 factor (ECF subfamily)